jgi:very-short-patch-repair endonuclease
MSEPYPERRSALSATCRQELQIARVAAGRHRVIELAQLVEHGISPSSVSRWVRRGRLRRRHRGVYVYGGGDLSREGEFLAAVLAVGDDAALGGYAAAALWDFWPGNWKPIEVTAPRDLRGRPGIRIHSVLELPPHAVTVRFGIPVTTPAWTILDLAATVRRQRRFRRLVHEAEAKDRVTPALLRAEIARSPWHRGAKRVLVEIADGPKPTRSGREDDLLDMLRRHNAPPFKTNAHVPGTPAWVEVDFMFEAQKLVIEVDGGPWHKTKFRREFDAAKRSLIRDVDYEVMVLVDDDVEPRNEELTMARVWGELALRVRD